MRELREECLLANNRLLVLDKGAHERSVRKEESCLLDDSLAHSEASSRYSDLRQRLDRYERLFRELPMDFDDAAKLLR